MKRSGLLLLISLFLVIPESRGQKLNSGLAIGSNCPAFDPYHVSGPDRNTRTCPMCKYGSRSQGILLWVNDSNWKSIEPILLRMEREIKVRGLRRFRVFVMYMNPDEKSLPDAIREASGEADHLKLRNVALTVIPGPRDKETAALFQINPDRQIRNTVLVYSRRKVVYRSINLTESTLHEFMRTCDESFAKDPLQGVTDPE